MVNQKGMLMMIYRALVGIQGTEMPGKRKKEREAYHLQELDSILMKWNSHTLSDPPYYDAFYDTDKEYRNALESGTISKDENPLEALNRIKAPYHIFYDHIPSFDVEGSDDITIEKEYRKARDYYLAVRKPVPSEISNHYKSRLLSMRKKSKKTGLYAYSSLNPDAMFDEYHFPITRQYNSIIPRMDSSRLLNKNYGTMHDIIYLGDLDFEGTFLPTVAFRYDGEMLESNSNDDSGDPDEIKDFFYEVMDRKDYLALIECICN